MVTIIAQSLFSIGSFALGPWGALLLFIGNLDISYIAVDTKRKGLLQKYLSTQYCAWSLVKICKPSWTTFQRMLSTVCNRTTNFTSQREYIQNSLHMVVSSLCMQETREFTPFPIKLVKKKLNTLSGVFLSSKTQNLCSSV